MDMTKEALDSLVKLTPVYKSKPFTLTCVTNPETGEHPILPVRAAMVMEVVSLIQRFPQLVQMFTGSSNLPLIDMMVIVGKPALNALIAQNLGKFRDEEFESWVGMWSDEDTGEFIGCYMDMTMPEGIKSFFVRVIRYMQRIRLPKEVADLAISRMDEIETYVSGKLSNLAASPQSLPSIKSLLKDLMKDEEEPNPTAATPTNSPSSSPEDVPNSSSEDAEPTLGL